MRWVAPSCWSHCSTWWTPRRVQSVHNITLFIDRNCLSNITFKPKRSDYAMFRYGNPCGALRRVQLSLKAIIWRLSSPEHRVLGIEREKWASSLNHTFWRKSGISSILLPNHRRISTQFAMSFCLRVFLIWILYGYNWRLFFNILWIDDWERPE